MTTKKDEIARGKREEMLNPDDKYECSVCGFKGTHQEAVSGKCHLYKKKRR